jgi:release factor glutamine methyltransferase
MRISTVGEVLTFAQRAIDRLDAQYMLSHLSGMSRASLIANPDRILDTHVAATFANYVAERANGRPVAQILGSREFYGREFGVDENVLIPRPETEVIVEQVLARISEQNRLKTPASRALSILDLGTGSGALAITLAREIPAASLTAVDISAHALRVASANASRLNARVNFLESNWYLALEGQRYDIIVANPPYVAADDDHLRKGDLRFEPPLALTDGSIDGLESIRTIVAGAPNHLLGEGRLFVEHGYDQAERVRALFAAAGFSDVVSTKDLSGIERVTHGSWRIDV